MNCLKNNLFLAVTAAILLGLFACGEVEEEPDEVDPEDVRAVINYGHVPSISASDRYDELAPLRNYLENELDIKFNIQFASDYETVIDKLETGEYDFVTFGPLSYVQAADRGIGEAVLKPVRFGSVAYQSLIITHVDSGIDEAEDLRGRSFAFVDRDSASGYLFPRAYLEREGVDVDEELSTGFSGSHTEVVMNVWLRSHDAGAIYDDARGDVGAGERVMEETRILAKTSEIPNEPWTFRKSFMEENPELVEEIIQLMEGLDEAGNRGRRILESLQVDGFRRATDEDYEVIREYRDYLPDEEVQ